MIANTIDINIGIDEPNGDTIAAMLEAERIAKDLSVKGFDNADELFAELDT